MFLPKCAPILIGSLPLTDHGLALEMITRYSPEIPLWPQLPARAREGMVRQFVGGFPGLAEEGNKFWVDSSKPDFIEQMTAFYEDFLEAEASARLERSSRFGLKRDSAAGFFAFEDFLATANPSTITVKGQITGPVTTGIGLHDADGNPLFYREELRDMLTKHIGMTARWQVEQLQQFCPSTPPILFIDEPGMVSFSSTAFAGVSGELASTSVGEVIEMIKGVGGLAGIHICANGDWGPALTSGADIISFDAYSFFENFILYRHQLLDFLAGGGILAWGIIPTGDPRDVAGETVESLLAKWQDQVDTLSSLGIAKSTLLQQTLIAPACGTGSLSLELAEKVLAMTAEVSARIRTTPDGGA